MLFAGSKSRRKVTGEATDKTISYNPVTGMVIKGFNEYTWEQYRNKFCNLVSITFLNYDTELCHCGLVQTIVHLLVHCPYTKRIWEWVERKLNDPCLKWAPTEIMSNRVHPKVGNVINLMVLMIKQLIYSYKCLNKKLSYKDIVLELNNLFSIDKVNTGFKKTDKVKEYWEPVCPILDSLPL